MLTHNWIQEQSNETLLNQQKDLNQSVIHHIENSIEQRKKGLEQFAQQLSDGYRLRPTKVIQEKLDSRVGLHQYFNGGLLVLSGKAISIADSPAVKKRRGIDFSDRGHVKAVRHTGATIITRPRIGRGLKSPVFAINTPIKSESGEILGFILGVTKLKDNNFFKDISDESFGNYGSLFVIDPNLKLFVTASDKKLAMQKLPQTGENPVIDKVLAGSYSGFISDNKGGEVLFSAAKIDSMGFVVIHTLSEKVLSKKGWSLTFKFFSAFLALTLLVTLVIWVLLRNQLMVLRNTSDVIVEMVEGKRPYHALHVDKEDEVGSLILSFNKLQNRLSENIAALQISNEKLEERVDERTKELQHAQDKLIRKERLATLGQLTATVSHELRNPLGAMRPSLYIVEKKSDKSDDVVQSAIKRIDRNIDRCDRIIDELLDFTRINELHKETTHIDEWIESVIEDQIIPEGIQVEKDFSLNTTELDVDTGCLRRAIINVLDNAYHAMMDGNQKNIVNKDATIKIKTVAKDNRAEIIISDTGSGIPKEVLDKIFEPLFSTKGFGVGLGMPTVQQIMKQHDGGIEIKTQEGKGTVVTLWLPSTVNVEDEDGAAL